MTLGSIVTVAGRNYGSPRMVTIFAVTFVAPIALGLILRWTIPHVVLGLLIVPFMFIIKGSADHVRQVLFSAVIGHKQARQIAQRFDRALNTMSHGLVMLEPATAGRRRQCRSRAPAVGQVARRAARPLDPQLC